MKAKLVEEPPATGDWIYELKFDGIRLIGVKKDDKVSLLSRNENELTGRFPEIVRSDKNFASARMRDRWRSGCARRGGQVFFSTVASARDGRAKEPCLFLCIRSTPARRQKPAFTAIGGAQKRSRKTLRRRGRSHSIFGRDWRRRQTTSRRGEAARSRKGIIGKQRNSVYEPGRRSGAWIKLKCVSEQEFVIGGYTPPQGSRKYFGAILVGYYENKKLVFAGKVGTGFTAKSLSMLYKKFQKEARDDCPFIDLPSKQNGQWVQDITPSMMRKMHWVNPVFVCEIKFAEWTRDKKLRAPVFLGLREDKKPGEVVRES